MDSSVIAGLSDDLQELNLDRPLNKPLKSTEELEKLTVDEHLTGIERAVYLLSSGQEVQRISVITALPSLLKENNAECMRRVVPKVREVLYVAQQDMQLAASSAFLQILQDQLVPVQNYTQTFLQTILSCVDSKDAEIAEAWLDTLLDVIDLLPKEIIKKDILGIAISKGQLSQPVQARLSCCKILGKVATKFESFVIKKEILPVVQQLCQDVEHEVRACMCNQLDSVARGLGLEATKSEILPELVELTNDEESDVRITGLDTVVSISSMLDDDTCVMTIIPLMCKFCQRAMQAEDMTLPVVAKQLGRVCHELQRHLSDEQKTWFIDYYKKLCRVGIPVHDKHKDRATLVPTFEDEDFTVETRRNAAYNFPAMATFVGGKSFKAELAPVFTHLCKDPHIQVRKTLASGFHEVAKLLGHSVTQVFPDLITLLKDDSIEVLRGAVTNFKTSIESLTKGNITDSKISTAADVIQALMAAEVVVFASNDWRLQEDMMHNMACLGKICSNDVLYNNIVPILLQKMKHGRALPVRHAAARSLLVLIRCLRKLEQREELTHTLVQDFCHGRSCHSRGLFIVICKYVIELYSKTFFKEHLFEYILSLTSDPVPNIRMRTCALLPDLKRLIKLPYDNTLKGSLEQCIRKILVNEKDRDVALAMKQAVEELDQIPLQMESMVSRRKNYEDDVEDQLKEDEEKLMIEREEKERKEEELRAAKGDKGKMGKKDSIVSKIPSRKSQTSSGSKLSVSEKGPGTTSVRRDSKPSTNSVSPSTSASSSAVCNGRGAVRAGVSSSGGSGLQPHMIKSKSTTSIPSLSHIPRPEARPSTPPRKEPSCRIPVYHSLPRSAPTAGGGSSVNKLKASPTTQRSGSIPAQGSVGSSQRKGSAGSLPMPSHTAARRGSIGSANSTSSTCSEPSLTRVKSRTSTTTLTTGPKVTLGRKTSDSRKS